MKKFTLLFVFLILFVGISYSQSTHSVYYSIGNTHCQIDFFPRGDMADYTGIVRYENGSGHTDIEYNQSLSSKKGKYVYKEYSDGEYTGMYLFDNLRNTKGVYIRADGNKFKMKEE